MSYNSEYHIDITGADLVQVAKDVYDLSVPQGLGCLQAKEGPLSNEDAESLVDHLSLTTPLNMDYIHGRACKFIVFKDIDGGRLYIRNTWYDHTDSQFEELLNRIGVV